MSRENDETILIAIGQITLRTDFDDPKQLNVLIRKIGANEAFMESRFGQAFYNKIKLQLQKTANQRASMQSVAGRANREDSLGELIRQSDEKTENLIRDIDESLFQVASQKTTRTTQKIVWSVLAFSIVNTIGIFFVALFLWKMNMG